MHFSFKNGMHARRRSGHRSWAITGGLLILAATMACSLFSGGPDPTTSPPPSPQARPSPTSPRPPSAAEIVEAAAPASLGGLPLTSLVVSGADLVANQPELAAVFSQAGVDPAEVEVAVRAASAEAGVVYQIGVVTWPGAYWGSVLAADIAAAAEQEGMTVATVEVAGRPALRLRWADAAYPDTLLVASGDSVVFLRADDGEALEASVDALPEAAGEAEPAPFLPGMGSLMLVVLSSPIPPVCVGEPPGRHHIQVLAIDTAVGVPSPYNIFMMTGLLGPMPPAIPQTGALADFVYAASRYGGGLERLTIEDRSLLGGFGQYLLEFPVQHCLGGEWLDGERVVRITPPSSTHFTAEVVSGTICEESGGIDFSGTLDGDRISGSDLKVCPPEECVEAGFLPNSALVPYDGTIADDGMSMTINWEGRFYEIEYDNAGAAIRCTDVRPESHTFTVTRQSWE